MEGEERDKTEAGLAEVMGGEEIGETGEQDVGRMWGGRDVLAEQHFPSRIQDAMDDDMLMLTAEQEEINQMLTECPHRMHARRYRFLRKICGLSRDTDWCECCIYCF